MKKKQKLIRPAIKMLIDDGYPIPYGILISLDEFEYLKKKVKIKTETYKDKDGEIIRVLLEEGDPTKYGGTGQP